MKLLVVVAAANLLMLAGCATTLETHSDHDRSQSFASYRTFAWMAEQPMMAAPEDVARVSPLNRTHQPVWHGWGTRRITEGDVKNAADLIPPPVASILKEFPPG